MNKSSLLYVAFLCAWASNARGETSLLITGNYRDLADYSATSSTNETLTHEYLSSDLLGGANMSGTASLGSLSAFAYGRLLPNAGVPGFNFVGGTTDVSFSDIVTPSGGTGAGTFTPLVHLDGALRAEYTGTPQSSFSIPISRFKVVVSLTDSVGTLQTNEITGLNKGGFWSGTVFGAEGYNFQPTFDITYGDSYTMSVALTAFASAVEIDGSSSDWSNSATSEFDHTLTWRGGTLSQGGTLSGKSGRDWTQPVPEPATLMALGLGVAALARKKRSA